LQKVKILYDISVVVCARFIASLKIDIVLGIFTKVLLFI